jgi:hypothetical protein
MVLPSCLPRGWLGDESFPADPECSCGLTGAPSEFHRLGCDRTLHPYLDEVTLALVEEAVDSLACLRGSGRGDAGAALSALASLIAEAHSRLPDAVADAREADYTWAEIGTRLATTASTAWRRYGDYARWRAGLAVQED